MANWVILTRADAPKFQKLVLWLLDLPARGTNFGGGIHVTIPDTIPNPPPLDHIGWTTRFSRWVAKPSNDGSATDEFAIKVRDELQAAWQAKKSQLTPAQRTWVQSHLDVASDIELLAAWKRSVQNPDGSTTEQVVEADDVEPEA